MGFVKLSSECFCGNRIYKMNIEFCCHLCCNSSMIFRDNRPPSLALIFVFRPLFLVADDVFPWFVYAVMTLETSALDTPNKWPFWLQMLQLNLHQQYARFENMTWLRFCDTSIRTLGSYDRASWAKYEERRPTRCNSLMFIISFCLNMFRASLCPSSGEQRPSYCIWCVVLVLLDVVGSGCGALSCRMWALVLVLGDRSVERLFSCTAL